MDSIFRLEDGERATYLHRLMRTLGATYVCLWSISPQPTNCLISKAGYYKEEIVGAASSSHGTTPGQQLFDEYRQFFFDIRDHRVPGLAFENGNPFMELNDGELQRLVSTETQMQFYLEAKIKRAVFMGCKAGEIELGFSIDHPQVNLEGVLRNWFPEDFSQQATHGQLRPSSSESSLHSLSMDSSECPTLLFSLQNTPPLVIEPTLRPTLTPHQNTLSPLHQALYQPFGNNTSQVNEAMTKALFAVLSASSSHQDYGINNPLSQRSNTSAFKKFDSSPGSRPLLGVRRQNMVKKAIEFFRALNYARQSQERVQRARPNTVQMHHMISERRRREKLNQSFETLRSLLPPGTKKDKATVLKKTTECLASLKAQVEDLTKEIENLETQISHQRGSHEENLRMPSNERLHVHITNLPETSQGRVVDLTVLVREEVSNSNLVIRVLEFLKHIENVEVMSIEADMMVDESCSINRMVLRLKIEADDNWDQSAFQKAVRRVVADLAR